MQNKITYLIVDTALSDAYTLMILQKYYPVSQSLFKGTKDESLENVAPFILQIDKHFKENLKDEPGLVLKGLLFFESDQNIDVVANHFRKFIYQKINNQEYFFRFWDGRVLKKFLPTCSSDQLKDFFNSVSSFIFKDEDATGVRFSFDKNKLFEEKAELAIYLN